MRVGEEGKDWRRLKLDEDEIVHALVPLGIPLPPPARLPPPLRGRGLVDTYISLWSNIYMGGLVLPGSQRARAALRRSPWADAAAMWSAASRAALWRFLWTGSDATHTS